MALTIGDMVAKLELDADNFNSGMRRARSEMDDTKRSSEGLGHSMATGLSFAVATVAVDAFISALGAAKNAVMGVIDSAAGFEQSISNIGAVAGASKEQMSQLSEEALRLGAATSYSAQQAAAGIEELVKGGVGIEDILNGAAEATLNLAAAGGVAVADAAEIAANAMSMFGKSGAELAGVADQIAGAANASSLSVTDFKFSLSAVGAVASAAGISFEETATAIAAMGTQGIKGSDAGTSLKAMLNTLQPTTKSATAAFKELGIITADGANQFIDANGKIKSFTEIAGVLKTQLGGLTEAQRLQALETMFGADGMRAATVLFKEGAEGMRDMASAMKEVTAAQVAEMRLDNLRGDIEKLNGSLETFAIIVGGLVLPVIRPLVQGFTDLVNMGIEAASAFSKMVDAFTETQGLSQTEAIFAALHQSILQAFGPNTAQLFDNITGKIGDFFASLQGVGGGQNPLEVFAAGVERASEIILRVFDHIGPAMEDFAGTVEDVFSGDATGAIDDWADAIADAFSAIGDLLADQIDLWQEFGANLVDVFSELASGDFAGAISEIQDLVMDMMNSMRDLVLENIPQIGEAFADLGELILQAVGEWGPALMEGLTSLLGQMIDWIVENGPTIGTAFGEWAVNVVNWIGEAGVQLLQTLGDMLSNVLQFIIDYAPQVAGAFAEWVPSMIGWVLGTALPALIGNIMSMVGTVADWLASGGAEMILTAAIVLGMSIVTGVIQTLQRLDAMIRDWFSSNLPKALDAAKGIAEAAGQGVGTNLIQGVINGITGGIGRVAAAAQNVIQNAISAFNREGNGSSPYERFATLVGDIGIMGGIAMGIGKGKGKVDTAIAGFMSELVSNSSNAVAAFGQLGGQVVSSMFDAIAEGTAANGQKLARDMEKLIQELEKAGVENWREMGDQIAEALHTALVEGTPEAQQAALQMISEASQVLAEANSPGGIWRRRTQELTNLAHMTEQMGAEGAKVGLAFIEALTTGASKDINKFGDLVQNLIAKATEKGIAGAAEMGRRMEEILDEIFSGLASPEREAELVQEFKDLAGAMGRGLDELKNKVKTPVEAAMQAATDAIRDSGLVEEFGREGAKAMGAWTDALGDPRVATQVVNGMQKMVDAGVKAGVEGAAEMGQRMQQAFINYLQTHDEAYLEEGKAIARQLWAGTQQIEHDKEAAKLAEKVEKALESANDRVTKALTGKMNFSSAIATAFADMGTATQAAIDKWEPETIKNLSDAVTNIAKVAGDVWKDNPAQRDAFMTELFAAWQRVMAEQSPESIAALQAVIGGHKAALEAAAAEMASAAEFSMENVVNKLTDARWANRIGSAFASLFNSGEQYIKEGGEKNARAFEAEIVKMLTHLDKMGPRGRQASADLMAILQQAQDEGWPAVIDKLKAWVERWGIALGDGVRAGVNAAQNYLNNNPLTPPEPGFDSNFGANSPVPPGGQTPPGTNSGNRPGPPAPGAPGTAPGGGQYTFGNGAWNGTSGTLSHFHGTAMHSHDGGDQQHDHLQGAGVGTAPPPGGGGGYVPTDPAEIARLQNQQAARIIEQYSSHVNNALQGGERSAAQQAARNALSAFPNAPFASAFSNAWTGLFAGLVMSGTDYSGGTRSTVLNAIRTMSMANGWPMTGWESLVGMVPSFAAGGMTHGPTWGLMGDNPSGLEMAIPLDEVGNSSRAAAGLVAFGKLMADISASPGGMSSGGGHGPGFVNTPGEEVRERRLAHMIAEEMYGLLRQGAIVAKLDPGAVHADIHNWARTGTAPFVVSTR